MECWAVRQRFSNTPTLQHSNTPPSETFMPFEFPWKLEFPADQVTRVQYLVISLVGFALLVWFFKKVVVPMVNEPLVDRQKAIASEAEQVEQTYRETAQMKSDYERRL